MNTLIQNLIEFPFRTHSHFLLHSENPSKTKQYDFSSDLHSMRAIWIRIQVLWFKLKLKLLLLIDALNQLKLRHMNNEFKTRMAFVRHLCGW